MKYLISILLLTITTQLTGQKWCNEEYNKIGDLQMNSYSVFKDESESLFTRIRKSKKIAKQALKLAYETIEANDCKKYSNIVDRIIEIELQLGNKKNAEKIALNRLNKRTPEWKSRNGSAYSSDLGILAAISNYKKSNSFYKNVRKNKGLYGVCGTTTYGEDVFSLLWKAKKLYENYGKIYCLKFLQGSTIIINEDIESAELIWVNIYDLLVKSMNVEYSYEEIKSEFESSEIQHKDLRDWELASWEFEFQRSRYYIDIFGTKIYFKTNLCPEENNKYKRCQPKNCKLLKTESILYKKIKEYAS